MSVTSQTCAILIALEILYDTVPILETIDHIEMKLFAVALQFTLGNELDVVKVSFGARNTVVVVFQFYFYISAPLKLVLLRST
jgi:hypothetical protein